VTIWVPVTTVPRLSRPTWVARQQGDAGPLAGFTIAVTRTEDGYQAGPDSVCD